ncbi:IgaA/UmoB family intracellular growth attenuator [Dickeya oryzae]
MVTTSAKKTDVDVYLTRQVVRQGNYLSLHNEVKFFPLQQWGKKRRTGCRCPAQPYPTVDLGTA